MTQNDRLPSSNAPLLPPTVPHVPSGTAQHVRGGESNHDMRKHTKLEALVYCVEVLALQSLMEGSGAIRAALESDARVWELLGDSTKKTLREGLGYTDPK